MKNWLRRIRGAVGMGLTWAIGWGALGGLLLTLFPIALVAVGLASLNPGARPWPIIGAIVIPFTLLSAVSASVTLMVARKAEDQALLEASEDGAELGLTGDEAQALPADRSSSLHGYPAARSGERVRSGQARGPTDT